MSIQAFSEHKERGLSMSKLSNIIVTEDDESLNHLMQKILRREGFNTEGAMNGAEAIDRVAGREDALLLLDYGLPDMTGGEVIQSLSRNKNSVPFMLITGKGNEHIAVDMMKRGAKDYIIKDDSFIEQLPLKVKAVVSALDWEKDVEEAEETLQKKSYCNQVLLDSMPYVAIMVNPITNDIIASNAAAEKAGMVSGRKCSITNGGVTCPWCNPPVLMEKGEEHESVFKTAGRLWDAHWIAIDDNMYMVFAYEITDRKEIFQKAKSEIKELKDLTDMADGIDRNLSGLKDNLTRLADNLLHIKDKSDK
jgi:FixJ family two-component response regulator